jgi:hypothetical protein
MSWLIGAAIIAAVIFMIVRRGLQMKDLAHKGVVAEGTVIRKFRRGNATQVQTSAAYLRYEFKAPDGKRFERSVAVSEEVFETFEEGSKIDVVYVEGKPQVNGAKYMVNLSREALKLPPL